MYEIYERLLREKGCRTVDVSKVTGINQAVFSEWKKGKSNPKPDKIQKIADFFNVSITEFYPGGTVDESKTRQRNEFEAKNQYERDLILLMRKIGEAPDEDKNDIINQFQGSIGIYLKAKGLTKED